MIIKKNIEVFTIFIQVSIKINGNRFNEYSTYKYLICWTSFFNWLWKVCNNGPKDPNCEWPDSYVGLLDKCCLVDKGNHFFVFYKFNTLKGVKKRKFTLAFCVISRGIKVHPIKETKMTQQNIIELNIHINQIFWWNLVKSQGIISSYEVWVSIQFMTNLTFTMFNINGLYQLWYLL